MNYVIDNRQYDNSKEQSSGIYRRDVFQLRIHSRYEKWKALEENNGKRIERLE